MKIIVDTEYTTDVGWRDSGWSGPGQHREIVQIAAIAVDDEFRELANFDLLIRPRINARLSELFTELTHIPQETVDREGLDFAEALGLFFEFCGHGSTPVICMNGDEAVFRENCALTRNVFPFPNPFHRLDPFLLSLGIEVDSSGDLHKLTRTPLSGHTHNALHDVRSMAKWLAEAQTAGVFVTLDALPTELPAFDRRSRKSQPRRLEN